MEQQHFGFWGRILRVNLKDGTTRVEEPDPSLYRIFMGGRNMALYYLLNEVPPGTPALSSENKLIFATSITTGAPVSGQGRHTAATISPLTGGLADSQCGGWWGAELKFAGYDAIIVEESSPELVYLLIEDDLVKLMPAEHLRGKETGVVQKMLHEAHSTKVRILQMGPAGENGVRYANVTADLRNFHGRGGIGAVMGSKNIRAIVVKGSHKVRTADPEGLKKLASWFAKSTKDHPAISLHHELGTAKGVVPLSVMGMLPTYNFQDGSFKGAEGISGETMKKVLNGKTETCFSCAVSCKRSVEGENEKFKVTREYGGPEYETIGLMGSSLGVDDIVAVAACNEKCNALGLDTISTASTIAWATECYERELLTDSDTGGIQLKWNDPETSIKLIEMIAYKQGFGELLAEGSRQAARNIGRDTEKYAMQVKGQEVASHEPRGKWGVGLGYAVSPTGGDHLQAAHDPWFDKPGDYSKEFNWVDLEDLSPLGIIKPVPAEDLSAEKVRLFVYLQYVWAFHDVLDWCIFTAVPEFRAFSIKQLSEIVNHVTGWRTSVFEIMKAGERSITMARAFNCLRGFTSADDKIPDRFFEPMRDGTLKGHAIDRDQFNKALKLYYGMMGWDEEGVPRQAKLEELGVGWIWDKLKAVEVPGDEK
ncbi:MAG: aldehyde ferredoxin oxidoreductase family protein [Bacillota bacterium]|nr:aldehyde ferredoxin oxidoreductase family protein [Bacillota bacterium]MDW7678839.1 aldehyde ferredoxin oxidoreductase family protein [Bacillota bacterium]